MDNSTADELTKPAKIDLKREIERSEWKHDPIIVFDQKASLAIAQWVLFIFAGVYALSFGAMLFLFSRTDVTFEKGSELVKFTITRFKAGMKRRTSLRGCATRFHVWLLNARFA